MDRRRLGRSPVEVTALGLGGAPMGGLYTPVSDAEATATVRRAWERGIRYFDTAPHYAAGRGERRLGAALAEVAGSRPGAAAPEDRTSAAAGAEDGAAAAGSPENRAAAAGSPENRAAAGAGGGPAYVLSTKVGRLLVPLAPGEPPETQGFPDPPPYKRRWDWTADGVRRSLEESLERLGTDRVDLLYLHDPDDHEEEVYASAYPALAALRDEGVVGAIGAGMNQTPMLTRFVERLDLDVVLCAGRYTLLDHSAERDLLPACERRGTSVVIGGVYNSGLLAGGTTYDYRQAPPETLARVRELERICAAHGVPLRAAALRFAFRHPAVVSVLVGCRTPAEVDDNADLYAMDVPDALWADLLDGEGDGEGGA